MFRNVKKETMTIPAQMSYLTQIRDFVERLGKKYKFSDKVINSFKLVIDEACTNIIRHGYRDIQGGEINLKTEELDVGIAPKARGAISGLTNVGLASLVHVGGTLAEPKIGLDVKDVAKKYVGYSAFIATGGLSFLAQKVVDTAQANVDQCEKILGDLENLEDEEAQTESDN